MGVFLGLWRTLWGPLPAAGTHAQCSWTLPGEHLGVPTWPWNIVERQEAKEPNMEGTIQPSKPQGAQDLQTPMDMTDMS